MDHRKPIHSDAEEPKFLGQQSVLAIVQMLEVVGEGPLEVVYLLLAHCLKNELPVRAEEEKGPTGAGPQTRILDLFDIVGRVQGLAKLLICDLIRHSDPLESLRSVLFHYYLSL